MIRMKKKYILEKKIESLNNYPENVASNYKIEKNFLLLRKINIAYYNLFNIKFIKCYLCI